MTNRRPHWSNAPLEVLGLCRRGGPYDGTPFEVLLPDYRPFERGPIQWIVTAWFNIGEWLRFRREVRTWWANQGFNY
jgi:hypothetical protein